MLAILLFGTLALFMVTGYT